MSFILDALKKSELERQRQSMPGLVEGAAARSRARLPVWAIALGVLLAVNLIVLAVVLSRGHGRATPVGAASAPVTSPNSAASSAHFSPLDPPVEYAPEIPVVNAPVPVAVPPPAERAASAGLRIHHLDPLLTDGDYKSGEDEVLPTINELSLSGAQALPELHLDVHVFATRPGERFVYVNMRKYHEGATLQEGPTIERIRRDGVILTYQGLRFLLPRQ